MKHKAVVISIVFFFFSFFVPGITFLQEISRFCPLSDVLDEPWSQGSCPFCPPVRAFLLSRLGFSVLTARRFLSNVADSRSRSPLRSTAINFHARKKYVLCTYCTYALGETRTHEVDCSRHADHFTKPPGTPALNMLITTAVPFRGQIT